MLNLYLFVLKLEKEMELESGSSEENEDLLFDCKTLINEIFGKIDPSIRKKLQKRGITVFENIYTGFDTEFININTKFNKLLSVQLAVNTKILMKFPKYNGYELSTLEPLTGEEYKIIKE